MLPLIIQVIYIPRRYCPIRSGGRLKRINETFTLSNWGCQSRASWRRCACRRRWCSRLEGSRRGRRAFPFPPALSWAGGSRRRRSRTRFFRPSSVFSFAWTASGHICCHWPSSAEQLVSLPGLPSDPIPSTWNNSRDKIPRMKVLHLMIFRHCSY